ncbi:MAG: SOS response-associated peptidase [Halofilum sp. (in: g-proteobacteria)]
MCGRYTLRNPTGHPWIDPEIAGGVPPRYNIAPGQQVLTLGRDREGERVTRLAHWGFHPHWLPAQRRSPINARIEGVADKPLFRRACAAGRCLVPADGWYEWQARASGSKQPFFFHRPDDGAFFFAGLAARDGAGRPTLAILTRDADPHAAAVHTRMPVVVPDEEAALGWLDAVDASSALSLLTASTPGALAIDPVSRRVNRPENDDPACVRVQREEPGDEV